MSLDQGGQQADLAWAALLREGDPQAFEELVARYHAAVYAVVCHWLGNEEEAKDVTQETFVRAWSHAASFRGEASVKSWLFAIARNACRNTFRTWARKHRASTLSLNAEGSDEAPPVDVVDPSLSVLDRMDEAERHQLVRRALQELDPDFRIVVTLCDFEESSYEEAAAVCGCPVGTVRSRLHRGRSLLKAVLGKLLEGGIR